MRSWIHHALLPLCRLVVVVYNGVWDVFLAHFRPLNLKVPACDYIHTLKIMVHNSFYIFIYFYSYEELSY